MAQTVKDFMTRNLCTIDATASVRDAARLMKEEDIGPVLVTEDGGGLCGILTDRDIAVRAVAEGRDTESTEVRELVSQELVTIGPDTDAEEAARIMREHALRRTPVVEDGRAVGMVSIGDLAIERDPRSALADISAAPPNT